MQQELNDCLKKESLTNCPWVLGLFSTFIDISLFGFLDGVRVLNFISCRGFGTDI